MRIECHGNINYNRKYRSYKTGQESNLSGSSDEGVPIKMINTISIAYLLIINCFAFILMGTDKKKARHNTWRISEKALFLTAISDGKVFLRSGMWQKLLPPAIIL